LLDTAHRHPGKGHLNGFRHLPDGQSVTGQGIPPEAQGKEGHIPLLLVRNIDRSSTACTKALISPVRRRSSGKSGPKIFTAILERLPERM
jgi:hypothetical protein